MQCLGMNELKVQQQAVSKAIPDIRQDLNMRKAKLLVLISGNTILQSYTGRLSASRNHTCTLCSHLDDAEDCSRQDNLLLLWYIGYYKGNSASPNQKRKF